MNLLNDDANIAFSGIYIITNTVNDKRYVGSSINCLRRFKEHVVSLTKGAHPNAYLQAAYAKYGSGSFLFEVIEKVSEDCLLTIEQQYIDVLRCACAEYGYNLSKIAGKVDWSEERRQKASRTKKGRPSPLKGRKRPAEVGEKISAAKKAAGHKHSEGAKQKMRAAFEANREKRMAQLEKVWESRRVSNSR